ncbi:MAG: hypothetical protein NDJ90_16200, partial [Oligoflexia bacterium]|nr:hypothetical protein [Oligoflexia bacterium]
MSKTRWIFVNRKNASDVIAVADLESARALSRLLKSVSMADDWIVRQEASLDELGYVEDVAPAAEAAVPAPAQAAVAAHAPVAAQAPAAVAPAFAAPPMPEVVQAPAAVTYSVRADATPLIEPFAEGVPPPFHMTERKNGKRRHQRYDVEF